MLDAIDDLPEAEREAFDLVRIQGMTQAEAAEVLGVSAMTVKRRLNRGLQLLADALGDLRPDAEVRVDRSGLAPSDRARHEEGRAMTADPRLRQLLDELLDSRRHAGGGVPVLPRAAAARCAPAGRRMRRVRAELDALFPPDGRGDARRRPPPASTALPQVPGYEVEGVLGRGGMGVVYRARHLRLNRPVALKMLLAGAYAGPAERERFQREAEAVAGLRHPNIVQVYDVGDADGRPYFTMEFVEGGSLAQTADRDVPQPARQAAALVATLADGRPRGPRRAGSSTAT